MKINNYKKQTAKKANGKADNLNYTSIDWWLFATVLSILGFGLMMVFSAGGVIGERNFADQYYFFKRQVLFVIVSLCFMMICTFLSRNLINKLHYIGILGSILLLLAVLSPLGLNVNGASRWISVFSFSIQPMEFAKIALVLYLAYFLSTHQDLVKTFSKGVIPPFFITGILCFLLILQPDFGSAMILLALLFFMCLIGGTRLIYLAISASMFMATAVMLIMTSPYRMRRFLAYMDPFKDAQGSGYQLVQSFYALAEGGLYGVGLGSGRQKLLYLPEAHNDFIVSVIGEEVGFLGITILMCAFAFVFIRCYRIVMGQQVFRDKLISFGLSLVLILSSSLNLAVITGLVPPKGVAMPFLSYGGSSMLASLICVGLLLNYSRTIKENVKEEVEEKKGRANILQKNDTVGSMV